MEFINKINRNNQNYDLIIPDGTILMEIKTEPESIIDCDENSGNGNIRIVNEETYCKESYDDSTSSLINREIDLSQETLFDIANSEAEGKRTFWLDSSTKLLIASLKELRPKVGKSRCLKNKKQMWSKISEILRSNGYNFNATQVETKFFSLERQYKKTQMYNKTGRNRLTCPYQSELDDLLHDKKSIHPQYLLDSETTLTFDETVSTDVIDSPSTENLDCTPSCSKKKKTIMEKFLDKVDEHARRKEENDLKIQKMLEESLKRKYERAERKEAIERRKLDLLEGLINCLKKE